MPIRDYKCNKCDAEFEAIQLSEHDAVSCEQCGSDDLERKVALYGGYKINGAHDPVGKRKQGGSFRKGEIK